jgi:hypothetical protein
VSTLLVQEETVFDRVDLDNEKQQEKEAMKQPVTRAELKLELSNFRKEIEGGTCTCPNMVTKMAVLEDLMRKHQEKLDTMITEFRNGFEQQSDRLSLLEVRVMTLERGQKAAVTEGINEVMAVLNTLVRKIK